MDKKLKDAKHLKDPNGLKSLINLEDADRVIGSSGEFLSFTKTPIRIPDRMYEIEFNHKFYIKASGDHLWPIIDGFVKLKSSDSIYQMLEFIDSKIEVYNGNGGCDCRDGHDDVFNGKIYITNIKDIKPEPVMCISVDSKDQLFFAVAEEKNGTANLPVLTHNCGFRFALGRLESIPSRMALGSTIGTTIPQEPKGRAIAKTYGNLDFIQTFYSEVEDYLPQWYKDRGLNEDGYDPEDTLNGRVDPENVDLGEDNEEISITNNKTTIEFSGESITIDNTKEQKFEEV